MIEKLNHEDILKIVRYVLQKNTRDDGVVYDVRTSYEKKMVTVTVRNICTGYEECVHIEDRYDDMESMKRNIAKAKGKVLTASR